MQDVSDGDAAGCGAQISSLRAALKSADIRLSAYGTGLVKAQTAKAAEVDVSMHKKLKGTKTHAVEFEARMQADVLRAIQHSVASMSLQVEAAYTSRLRPHTLVA
jgi:hypothetical protein